MLVFLTTFCLKLISTSVYVFSNRLNRTSINILSVDDLPEIHPLGCFESRLQTKICVKKEDEYVSRNIQETGAWEEESVFYVLKAMKLHSDAVFLGK